MGVRVRLARDVAARVGLGNQALFYYAYRDSAHIYEVIENDAVSSVDYFKGFFDYIAKADVAGTVFEGMDDDVLWSYIIDCTGVFVKRIIRGEPTAARGFV